MQNPFSAKQRARLKAFFSKPANMILVVFFVVLCMLTLYPLILLFTETFTMHAGKEMRAVKQSAGSFTLYSLERIFATSKNSYSKLTFYQPLLNTLAVAVSASLIAIIFGGTVAWLITRTNLKFKKFISTVFVFPYIMPAWTLATFWQTFFKNVNVGAGTSNGIMAAVFGIFMPEWFVYGFFPISLVLGLHPHRRHPAQHGRQP